MAGQVLGLERVSNAESWEGLVVVPLSLLLFISGDILVSQEEKALTENHIKQPAPVER